MSFSEFEMARINKIVGSLCNSKVPPEFKDRLRIEYSVNRYDIEICAVRPRWDDPSKETRTFFAKIK